MTKQIPTKVSYSRRTEHEQKQRRAKWQGELMMGLSFAMLIFMCLTINL
mgnify:FL=1